MMCRTQPSSCFPVSPQGFATSLVFAAGAVLALAAVASAQPGPPPIPALGTPPAPAQNQPTEAKRILGKMLFWDEQLSADNTMACATCHQMNKSGSDPRRARTPGVDNIPNNADDIFGSPGVIQSDSAMNYMRDTVFGLNAQVTPRTAQPVINSAFAPSNFWDGRARPQFVDPLTGGVVLNNNAALESQAVGPPTNDTEMAHSNRDWNAIALKIAQAKPMALATSLTSDVAAALATNPSYPQLFRNAFGDKRVDAARIAMAIATYERTLVSNQTPWDSFNAGNPAALTANQVQGLNTFTGGGRCNVCHAAATFTNHTFRAVGLRPPAEDTGFAQTTGNPANRGQFKVPGLRNVSLKSSFFHNGVATNLTDVVRFYARAQGALPQFPENQDPVMPTINIPPQAIAPLVDFLTNGLLDPRVRDGLFPFDSMVLASNRPETRPVVQGAGTPGTGGIVPTFIANMPSMIGSAEFRLGVQGGLGGASATLVSTLVPPSSNILTQFTTVTTTTLNGTGAGQGFATAHLPIPADASLLNKVEYFQWIIADAAAPGGFSRTAPIAVTYFCGTGGCSGFCVADVSGGGTVPGHDGTVDGDDFIVFINAFAVGAPAADVASPGGVLMPDGVVDGEDFVQFINGFALGC